MWLPPSFVHPLRLDLPSGLHLRPITAGDVDRVHPAVLGAQERLWRIFGEDWSWPPADLTIEQHARDLGRREHEIAAHESFMYALFDAEESAVLGCVVIDPAHGAAPAARAAWWVVDVLRGSREEEELDGYVRRWLEVAWPFAGVELPFNPADAPEAIAGANLMVLIPDEPERTSLSAADAEAAEAFWSE